MISVFDNFFKIASLEASQASTQQLEFFSQIKEYTNPLNGQNKYELNNPFIIQKFTELLLGFFQTLPFEFVFVALPLSLL